MSVLVEALSLIIPRIVLDISYPGGADSFFETMLTVPLPCRHACSDDKLVSVSFFGLADARVIHDELQSLGIVGVQDDRFVELACIDQRAGPTMPCEWLEWAKHEEGYTSCWMAGRDPGPLSAPPGWTPEQSRGMTFHDYRSDPGRAIQLGEEADGDEIWLDFQTGEILKLDPFIPEGRTVDEEAETLFTVSKSDGASIPERLEAANASLLSTIRAMLDARSYKYLQIDESSLTMNFHNERGSYGLYFTTNDKIDFVGLSATYGSRIPDQRRVAIAEALSRINLGIWLGNFELDFSEGHLRFRIGIDVEDGSLSETMVSNLLAVTLQAMERYHVPLMRIAFGDVEPVIALSEAA